MESINKNRVVDYQISWIQKFLHTADKEVVRKTLKQQAGKKLTAEQRAKFSNSYKNK